TDEALKDSTVNTAGVYGEMMEAVMGSKAMTKFFTSYISDGIRNIAYGNPQYDIANDELLEAFRKGVKQVNQSGQYSIDSAREEVF
ncbi:MAG: hypothetical protein Q4D33_14455, partial [Prevotellaceae bacterium]|nr:hypothetical protein [Prevotellaceae bacterium]